MSVNRHTRANMTSRHHPVFHIRQTSTTDVEVQLMSTFSSLSVDDPPQPPPPPPPAHERSSVSRPLSLLDNGHRRRLLLDHYPPTVTTAVVSTPSVLKYGRPLPEPILENGETPTHKSWTCFSDGCRRVDFVIVYSEPHDEYLVSASPSSEDARCRQFFLDQLRKSHLAMEFDHYKDQKDNVLVCVKLHVPWAVLCQEAERLRMRMPLALRDPEKRHRGQRSLYRRLVAFMGFDDEDERDDPSAFADGRLTCEFERTRMHRFNIEHPDTFFGWRERTEIVHKLLQECRNDPRNDRCRGVDTLLERGLFNAAYPLHDGPYGSFMPWGQTYQSDLTSRQRLRVEWASWAALFRRQPLNRIRNYFGEKFTFYFAFMDFYTKMLVFPSIFGILAFVYGLVSTETINKPALDRICDASDDAPGSYIMCPICQPPYCVPFQMAQEGCSASRWQYRLDNEATLLVSCATLIWCALFFKFWKRREAALAAAWDTYTEQNEGADMQHHRSTIRAAYEEKAAATKRSNPITMKPESYVPKHKRVIRVAASIAIATVLLCAAGASLMGLIVSRIALYGAFRRLGEPFAHYNVECSRWTVHGLIFIMVACFEWIYDNLAERLTELECPKTNEQFLSSLLWKVFIFEELVDFLPIAYAAWFRGKSINTPKDLNFYSEICEPGGCMGEVVELVAVLLFARLVFGNMAEIGYPFCKTMLARFRTAKATGEDSGHRSHWPQWLRDYHLNELKLDGVAEEYMEMMIQFSFVAFFVPALPLIPFVCLLNNIVEIRVDGINLLASHRRPVPARVNSLQIWNTFMQIILKVAVLCNAALIAFTSEIVPRLYYKYSDGNGTFVGFKEFGMSKILIDDWPALREHLDKETGGVMVDGLGHLFPDDDVRRNETADAAAAAAAGGQSGVGGADANADRHHRHRREAELGVRLENLTHCYYLDFRQETPPYSVTSRWWTILCVRLAAFTIFVVVFYILLFICDFVISDVPKDVVRKLKRRAYVVAKASAQRDRFDRLSKGAARTPNRPQTNGHMVVGNRINENTII